MFLRFSSYGLAALCLSLPCFATDTSSQQASAPFTDPVETYAIQSIDGQRQLVAHIDPLTQALVVSQLDGSSSDTNHENAASRIIEQYRTPAPDADIETLCLYEDTSGIGAFFFDVRGMARQHYLYTKSEKQWQQIALREFAVGGEPEYCMVDSASGQLFIAEEGIGVWQMSVAPESELSRHLTPLPLAEDTASMVMNSAGNVELTDEKGTVFTIEARQRAFIRDDMPILQVDGQTATVQRFGDAADDPAIWVNHAQAEQSLIIGTDKKAGLDVFDLNGNRLQHLPVGRVNNVDVRQSVRFGQQRMDLAVASNRSTNSLSVFSINGATQRVAHIVDLPTPLSDIYGLCLYQPEEGLEVLVNDSDGTYLRYALATKNGEFNASLIEQFSVPSQPEGCVADDKNHQLFYGEEATGIWRRSLAKSNAESIKIAGLNDDVQADIEGMDIYYFDQKRYLVASSQGNDSYAVYALDDNARRLGSFRIGVNFDKGIDGASETDGLAVSSVSLGEQYPDGLLVVQDGRNVMPGDKQNFKLISGSKLRQFIRQNR